MTTEASLVRALADPQRLDLLHATGLLDSPPEEAFDRFTRLASTIMHAPVALVSLVDQDRQFFKSQHGLTGPVARERQTPLSHSFCQHVVGSAQRLIVVDAREHPLLRDNLAIRDLQVIAYLGVPLQTSEGHTLGSLCTIDAKPRVWTEDEVNILKDLGVWVMTEIQLRLLGKHFLASYVQMRDLELQREELVQMLVHDLRNPLSSLMVGLELVHDSPGLDDDDRRYLNVAREGGESLLRMIGDILDVSKADAGRMTLDLALVAPGELIARACRQTEGLAQDADVTLRQESDPNLPPIAVDADKIRRVLVNLISNAIQHTGPSGTVQVSAGLHEERDELVLAVSDTGAGMPAEVFTQIFEKFGRAEARSKGRVSTGLGLPFCKKAIEAHGGHITVESEIGCGTTFRIELPYAGPSSPPTAV